VKNSACVKCYIKSDPKVTDNNIETLPSEHKNNNPLIQQNDILH